MKIIGKIIDMVIAIINKYAKFIAYMIVISACLRLLNGMMRIIINGFSFFSGLGQKK